MQIIVGLILCTFVLFMPISLAVAEEELFDTRTAAKHLDNGIAHLKAHKFDAAVAELEESISINPDAEGYYYLGYAYYMKGRTGDVKSRQKSIESFDKAYELDPNYKPGRYKPAPEFLPDRAGQQAEKNMEPPVEQSELTEPAVPVSNVTPAPVEEVTTASSTEESSAVPEKQVESSKPTQESKNQGVPFFMPLP